LTYSRRLTGGFAPDLAQILSSDSDDLESEFNMRDS